MYREKARRELHKNATRYIEQIMEATSHETHTHIYIYNIYIYIYICVCVCMCVCVCVCGGQKGELLNETPVDKLINFIYLN